MKKKVLVTLFAVVSTLTLSEMRKAYVLVPKDVNAEDVKVTGIINDGSVDNKIYYKQKTNGDGEVIYETVLGSEGNEVERAVVEKEGVSLEKSTDYPAYGDTQYLEMSINTSTSNDKVKFIMGYESGEEDGLTRYTVISSSDITDESIKSDLQSGFDDKTDPIIGLEMMDYLGDNYSYNEFPGKELNEGEMLINGFVAGSQIMNPEADESSNIVDIYYAKGDPGDNPINVVEGGASINPTGSGENNEFRLWAVRTNNIGEYLDIEGNVTTRENAERILLFANKGNNEALYTDFSEFTGNNQPDEGTFYADGDPRPSYKDKNGISHPYGYYDNFVFDIAVRFQGDPVPKIDSEGNVVLDKNEKPVMIDPSLIVNGVDVIAKGEGKKEYVWNFNNTSDITLDYLAGQFLFDLEGDSIIIEPNPGQDVPKPIAQKIYVMEDSGKAMDGEAKITTKYENVYKDSNISKYRTSEVKMKVMTKSGTTEKNYEIEGIKE